MQGRKTAGSRCARKWQRRRQRQLRLAGRDAIDTSSHVRVCNPVAKPGASHTEVASPAA